MPSPVGRRIGTPGTPRPPPQDGRDGRAGVARLALPYMPAAELDYAAGFRKLARLHVKACREGLTKDLALKRAHILFAVGNPLGAAFDCERALRLDPLSGEAHFLKGQAMLAMAGVKHGLVAPGPGAYLPSKILPPRRDLLMAARACFDKAMSCNPQDPQAPKALEATLALLRQVEQGAPPL